MKRIFVLHILLLIFFSCKEESLKPKIDFNIEFKELPAQESWSSKILFTEEGNLRAILYSDNLKIYNDKREILLDNIKVEFYDKSKEKSSTLTSKKGKVNDITKDMFAMDSVVAVGENGTVVRTEFLKWINKTQKITSDKFVTITSKEERIEGYGFESDQHLENYVIYDITYQTKIKDEQK